TLILAIVSTSHTQEVPAQQQGMEVLARGPVHEAFALPTDTQPKPGPVIPKQPPEAIEELPPDQKPEGDNVQWIPGYWAWDEEANDFLWVSGCWRAPPPGRRWMPGHWQEIDSGWIWVSGFWATANLQEVQYLPPPPPTLDSGPSAAAPDSNSFYAPGCWVYRENRYMWRPGHWVAYQPHWVWIPAHYVWTPTGCLFIDDYWDHPLDECGLLFAPVRFNLAVWGGARRPFVPSFVVHADFLIGSLFVHSPSRHYFFGDYFEPAYAKRGFVAWTDYHPSPGAYDPAFGYYRHLHGADPQWEGALKDLYRARAAGEVPRPPRTLVQQTQIIQNITNNKTTNIAVSKNINLTNVQNVTALAPLKEIHNTQINNLSSLSKAKEQKIAPTVVKLAPVPKDVHLQEQKMAKQVQDLGKQRHDNEAKMLLKGHIPVKHTDPPAPAKLTLPKQPAPAVNPPPAIRNPPAAVVVPKHEEKAIPKYEPPKPPAPPKKKDKDKDKKG
ncbi:MAG TPA: YXWGXW repeat-containing protein, partial [Gemmataceae bacterium]|nr:YXWGXW repeat-containing protein [Gemmataceae bacterium]